MILPRTSSRGVWPWLAAAVLLLVGVPADAQRRGTVLGDAVSPAGRSCAADAHPRVLPSVASLLDSASLAVAADFVDGSALLSLRFSEEGAPVWVRPLASDLPADGQARLRAAVEAAVRPQPGGRQPWNVRVRMASGGSVEVGRSERCAVEVVSSGTGSAVAVLTPQELNEFARAGPFRVDVRVGTAGEVRDVRLSRSSGSRLQDDMALRQARENRYLPELVDGFPVEAVYVVDARGRTRRQ
jgi:TonB family protein